MYGQFIRQITCLSRPLSPILGALYKEKLNITQFFVFFSFIQLFKNHSQEAFKKIVPVVGELTAENLDFTPTVLHDITKNVNIIFHSAATIKFNSPLKIAIDINVLGTLRTIQLAKKIEKLSAYVYLSTAFCNSNNRGLILEKVYPSHKDPYEMMKLSSTPDLLPDHSDSAAVKAMIGDHPNTYTFTKQLAENLIVKEMAGLPVAIIRPSVGNYSLMN